MNGGIFVTVRSNRNKQAAKLNFFLLVVFLLEVTLSTELTSSAYAQPSTPFHFGGVVNDYLSKRIWGGFWNELDPIQTLHENGFSWVRVGVRTTSSMYLKNTPPFEWNALPWRNEYWSSLEYAEQILREASNAGMRLNLFFFLSDEAAHAGQQNAPAEWEGLTVEETAIALQDYCYRTTRYFIDKGLNIEIYDIGNEIQMGILNFRPDERVYRPPGVDILTDMEYMKNNIWNKEAIMLKGAISGVKQANPNAKIVLHIAGLGISPDNLWVKTFFEFMIEQGVDYDYAGLSYPYSGDGVAGPYFANSEFRETIDFLASLGKKVIFSEFGYPNNPAGITGTPDPGYPFTPEGQADWVRDFIAFCLSNNNNIIGLFYFYPEYFPGMSHGSTINLESSGLFMSDTQIHPAMIEFTILFLDVPPRYWAYNYVMSIYNNGITAGCSTNPFQYCPVSPVTREQMAAFIVRAVEDGQFYEGPCAGPSPFSDVPATSPFCRNIERLVARGITAGCGQNTYCPSGNVTREQMAAFIVRR